MRILVTGNCGFIPQNFVRMFSSSHEIVGIDALRYASDPSALGLCRTFVGDISDGSFLDEVFDSIGKIDAVIHMAAESHVDNSIASPRPFMLSNFMGTFELLEQARKRNIDRFLFVSTDEVYGDLKHDDQPFSNLFQIKPSSPYSASKAAADVLVQSYGKTYGMNVVITRSCNNYGPLQYKEKFLPVVILNALSDKHIPIYGNGTNQREWMFVEDHCLGIMATLEHGKSGRIYNLGSGHEERNIDMVYKILDIMGKSRSLVKFVEDRKGHDFRYFLDSSIANNELGWVAQIPLDKGLENTIKWYSENRNYF